MTWEIPDEQGYRETLELRHSVSQLALLLMLEHATAMPASIQLEWASLMGMLTDLDAQLAAYRGGASFQPGQTRRDTILCNEFASVISTHYGPVPLTLRYAAAEAALAAVLAVLDPDEKRPGPGEGV